MIWAPATVVYLAVGAIIGAYSVDEDGDRAPLLDYLAIVLVWPIVVFNTLLRGR